MALHDQKSYVAHSFIHLDLMNTIMLCIMPFALHDADASAKLSMTEKVMLHIILIITNTMMLFMMLAVSCDVNTGLLYLVSVILT